MKKRTSHYRSGKKMFWILVVVFGFVLIAGSVRYQRQLRNTPTPIPSPTSITEEPVDSWNEYVNLRYRYRVRYPKSAKFFVPDRTIDSNEYIQTKPTSHTSGAVQIDSLSQVGYNIAVTSETITPGANLKSVIIKNEGVVGDIIPGRKGEYELLTWDRPVSRFESIFDTYGVESYRLTTRTPGEEITDIDAYYIRVSPTHYVVISNTVPTYGKEITRALERIAQTFEVIPQWTAYTDSVLGIQFEYPGEARVIEQESKRIIRGPYPDFTYDGSYDYEVILEIFTDTVNSVKQFANNDYEKELASHNDKAYASKLTRSFFVEKNGAIQIVAKANAPKSHYPNTPFYNKTFIQTSDNSILVIIGGTYAIYGNTESTYQHVLKTLRFIK